MIVPVPPVLFHMEWLVCVGHGVHMVVAGLCGGHGVHMEWLVCVGGIGSTWNGWSVCGAWGCARMTQHRSVLAQCYFTYQNNRGAPDPQFSDPTGSGSKPDLDILVPAGSGPDPTTLNPTGSELRDPGII